MPTADAEELVLQAIDGRLERELVDMTCDMVNIPSPTGEERALADYVAARFESLGMQVRFQEVEPERNNVIAVLKGTGTGPSLMFNAHFDTSTTGREEGLPFGHKPQARVMDRWIYGLGVSNMKSAFSAYYGAIRILQETGLQPRGDIIVTGVVGEIEKAPIDEYQGAAYRGGGLGTAFAAHHGVLADAAIIGEPTGLRLQYGNCGYIFARVTTKGVAQHTWSKERGDDAIKKMVQVMEAIREWEIVYERNHPHPLMKPRIGIGAIRGGYPYKPSICPSPYCHLYLDIHTLPGQKPADVKRELEQMLSNLCRVDASLQTDVLFYLCRNGYELSPEEPVVETLQRRHKSVFGKDAVRPEAYRYSVSADASILYEYGVPAVTYGPGGIRKDGVYSMYDENGELCSIDNLISCTKVYALSAMELCNRHV